MILVGDCVERMAELPAASVDAIVTDPPYGLEFMGKTWDRLGGARIRQPSARDAQPGAAHNGTTSLVTRNMPDAYVAGPRMQHWHEAWAREALRVLKPGGHLLAFGGTRTYHRLAAGIEDAGFEIRDCVAWLYGSGFPKSLDVSKAIDKAAGAVREVVGQGENWGASKLEDGKTGYGDYAGDWNITAPATPEAERWQGWGTAIKPAFEPIMVARKPLAGTVAGNVLEHGTGALNVDGCRIGMGDEYDPDRRQRQQRSDGAVRFASEGLIGTDIPTYNAAGRWPANVVLDQDAAEILDQQTGELHAPMSFSRPQDYDASSYKTPGDVPLRRSFTDSGGASRFFYTAKASRAERNAGLDGFEKQAAGVHDDDAYVWPLNGDGTPRDKKVEPRANHHPTVKPIDLMRWLVRLVTPPGGTILDPFTGSGTTGCAAVLEGFEFIGIEREADYARIAEARIGWWARQPAGIAVEDALEAATMRERVADGGQLTLSI